MKTGPFEFPRGIITFCQGVYVKKSGFKRKKKNSFFLKKFCWNRLTHSKLSKMCQSIKLNLKPVISSMCMLIVKKKTSISLRSNCFSLNQSLIWFSGNLSYWNPESFRQEQRGVFFALVWEHQTDIVKKPPYSEENGCWKSRIFVLCW